MSKLDKVAVGTLLALHDAGASTAMRKTMIATLTALADIVERLDKIEAQDLRRSANRAFVLDAPTNGAMAPGLAGMSLDEIKAKFALMSDHLHVDDNH